MPEASGSVQGSGVEATLGVEMVEATDERARARVPVGDHLMQPFGLVHGGVYAAFAETVACRATDRAVASDGMVAVGLANQTSFMRPVLEGALEATATRRHRGRTTWIWEVELTDARGRLCAISRVSVAVRPPL